MHKSHRIDVGNKPSECTLTCSPQGTLTNHLNYFNIITLSTPPPHHLCGTMFIPMTRNLEGTSADSPIELGTSYFNRPGLCYLKIGSGMIMVSLTRKEDKVRRYVKGSTRAGVHTV